jgi:hypothetical protein
MLYRSLINVILVTGLFGCVTVPKTKKAKPPRKTTESVKRDDGSAVVLHDDHTWEEKKQLGPPRFVRLDTPPFTEHRGTSPAKAHHIRLKLVSQKTDDSFDLKKWMHRNKISSQTYRFSDRFTGSNGNLPVGVPHEVRNVDNTGSQMLGMGIISPPYNIFLYGDNRADLSKMYITNLKATKALGSLDFVLYARSPKEVEADKAYTFQGINWAIIDKKYLYVSHGHRTYAKSSFGQNAYLSKIDWKKNKLIWRTKPLRSNASNFVIYKDTIISGYGFSAEPDYVYLIDKNTGKQIQQIKVKTGPEYLAIKGDKLLVKTYGQNYIFKILEP